MEDHGCRLQGMLGLAAVKSCAQFAFWRMLALPAPRIRVRKRISSSDATGLPVKRVRLPTWTRRGRDCCVCSIASVSPSDDATPTIQNCIDQIGAAGEER